MDTFLPYFHTIQDLKRRTKMQEVLCWVIKTFPALVPKIAWNQPMFTDHGTFIIGFSAAKQHFAVAPEQVAIKRFSVEINESGYRHTKELIQIPWEQSVNVALLKKIIQFNMLDKANCTTFWRK